MNFSFLRPTKIVKGTVKTVANFPAWLGFSFLKQTTTGMFNFIKPIYKPAQEKRTETFEAALQRLNITEQELVKRFHNLKIQSWVFGILSLAMIIYAIDLLFDLHVGATILALIISGFFFVKMSSCRFWMFQIKNRKLGCTVHEWLQNKVEEPKS